MAVLDEDGMAALARKVSLFLAELTPDERALMVDLLGAASLGIRDAEVSGFSIGLNMRANQQQIAVNRMESAADAADANPSSSGATDRRKAGLDNIQKMLDIIRSMNPQI
jgi:hypothetical protein